MSAPLNVIESEIARILAILDKHCERFSVKDKPEMPRVKEFAAAENSEANGGSGKTTQD